MDLLSRAAENPIRDPSPYDRRYKSSGGSAGITGEVTAQGTGTGDFAGITYVDMLVYLAPASRSNLLGTSARVYDHAGCILDLDDLVGFTVWADEKVAFTLDSGEDCDTVTPPFWSAVNRCCEASSATYRECV